MRFCHEAARRQEEATERLAKHGGGTKIRALGIDGCKLGWVAVTLVDGRFAAVDVVKDLETLLRAVDADAMGIDVPIGLPERGPRPADLDAKTYLGKKHSSVFLAPPRKALDCADHAAATPFAFN